MPTMALIDKPEEGILVVLGIEVAGAILTARVAVRTAILAVRVKYTGRSRLDQLAGAVTVAPPKPLREYKFHL